jgi:hypothetical protein
MRIFLVLVLAALAVPAFAVTDDNANLWVQYNGDHTIKKSRWGVHLEGQWRRSNVGLTWQQYQLRPGVNFQLSKSVALTLGYAFTETYRYGDFPALHRFPEHRVYEQVLYTRRIDKLDFANRFRLEQRNIGVPVAQADGTYEIDSYRYENRFRYQLRTNIPLSFDNRKNYIGIYDEIMFNFGKNVYKNVFDQNRAFISFGRNLGHETRAEIGFLEQTIQRRGGVIYEHNHTLQFVINCRLPFGH